MKERYSGFTLIEMLVVMGILVILMTMGIAAGQFAIERANRIQHASAVDQLYQGLQAYYTDNREYPPTLDFTDFSTALSPSGVLGKYIDQNAFEGGSDATYYYDTNTDTKQTVIVCVSLGGIDDGNERGAYCNGNGFGDLPFTSTNKVTKKDLTAEEFAPLMGQFPISSNWLASDKNWE